VRLRYWRTPACARRVTNSITYSHLSSRGGSAKGETCPSARRHSGRRDARDSSRARAGAADPQRHALPAGLDQPPVPVPGPVHRGRQDLPRAPLADTRRDRHDRVRQRQLGGTRRARPSRLREPGRPDAVRIGDVRRVRGPRRQATGAQSLRSRRRHLYRGQDAVRRRRIRRCAERDHAGCLRVQPRVVVRKRCPVAGGEVFRAGSGPGRAPGSNGAAGTHSVDPGWYV
jgi:hypothetical protein